MDLRVVDTPAAAVDVLALLRNLDTACAIAAAAEPRGAGRVMIRPHFKAHKSVHIARLQIALSAGRTVGLCCQKLHEAEALVAGGIRDVLLTNQVVHPAKVARLVALAATPLPAPVPGAGDAFVAAVEELAARLSGAPEAAGGDASPTAGPAGDDRLPRIAVLVDDGDNARQLHEAASAAGIRLRVLIEVDVGQRRCGVPDAAGCIALARAIAGMPGLRLTGIHAYHGGAQHVRSEEDRQAVISRVAALAAQARDALLAEGLVEAPCIVTGGGTGSFHLEAASGVYTEVQPGSYALHDADYARNRRTPAALWAAAGGAGASVAGPAAAVTRGSAGGGGEVPAASCELASRPTVEEQWLGPWVPAIFLLSHVMSRRLPLQNAPVGTAAAAAGTAAAGTAGGAAAGTTAGSTGDKDAALLARGWAVIDSGLKAQSVDSGPPVPVATAAEYAALAGAALAAADGSAVKSARGGAALDAAALAAHALQARHTYNPLSPVFTPGMVPTGSSFATQAGALTVLGVSDEHTTLVGPLPGAGATAALPPLREPLLLMPGHVDPFCNHFRTLVAFIALSASPAHGGGGSKADGDAEPAQLLVVGEWPVAQNPGL